jgi:hypothetical protein
MEVKVGAGIESLPLERLERQIGELVAHIAAATYRWLLLVGEFDRREGWLAWGAKRRGGGGATDNRCDRGSALGFGEARDGLEQLLPARLMRAAPRGKPVELVRRRGGHLLVSGIVASPDEATRAGRAGAAREPPRLRCGAWGVAWARPRPAGAAFPRATPQRWRRSSR